MTHQWYYCWTYQNYYPNPNPNPAEVLNLIIVRNPNPNRPTRSPQFWVVGGRVGLLGLGLLS